MCNEISCYESNKPALTVDPESRRLFLKGVASLPLAYVLADVELAKAAAHGGDTVTIDTDLAGKVSGYLAEPDDKNAPTVILIHEWWGLNDHIKAVAQEFKRRGSERSPSIYLKDLLPVIAMVRWHKSKHSIPMRRQTP